MEAWEFHFESYIILKSKNMNILKEEEKNKKKSGFGELYWKKETNWIAFCVQMKTVDKFSF